MQIYSVYTLYRVVDRDDMYRVLGVIPAAGIATTKGCRDLRPRAKLGYSIDFGPSLGAMAGIDEFHAELPNPV